MKGHLLPQGFINRLDLCQVVTLQGEIHLLDLAKMQKLLAHTCSSGISNVKYWNSKKTFISSTLEGELIITGTGDWGKPINLQILPNEPILDYTFINDNHILVVGEDPKPVLVDLRKL